MGLQQEIFMVKECCSIIAILDVSLEKNCAFKWNPVVANHLKIFIMLLDAHTPPTPPHTLTYTHSCGEGSPHLVCKDV